MKTRLPSLSALRVFAIAAQHLSFKSAAQELSVTPTAVSHQIRGLEDQLGVRLFERRARELILTRAGVAMLPKLREGMECLEEAVRSAYRISNRQSSVTLYITAPPNFATYWLSPRLTRFVKQHPEINLHLEADVSTIDGNKDEYQQRVDKTAIVARDVQVRQEDVQSMSIRFGRGQYNGRHAKLLFSPNYVPVCSPELLHGEKPLLNPRDIASHRLLHDDTNSDANERPSWEEWLLHIGMSRSEIRQLSGMHFKNAGLALAATEDELGIMLASYELAADAIIQGRLATPFLIPIKRYYAYYLVQENQDQDVTLLKLQEWLLQEAKETRQLTRLALGSSTTSKKNPELVTN